MVSCLLLLLDNNTFWQLALRPLTQSYGIDPRLHSHDAIILTLGSIVAPPPTPASIQRNDLNRGLILRQPQPSPQSSGPAVDSRDAVEREKLALAQGVLVRDLRETGQRLFRGPGDFCVRFAGFGEEC
ncbi:hypothetical protein CNMCM5793_005864 [Aspergillus hiratsukae]|uniref:Uncharacterized protein n=1 Tax=Aspergillus hiratsukae TaxID=1194566 RepID=A0A8H6PGF7_9EURO|nr:hypothetical protein CNMCM5793_005864 [Aspergillus hiratsukae]KAF7172495.1 hypothetical protein CNMCM6106_006674 [Aspergillus hiratsukae]